MANKPACQHWPNCTDSTQSPIIINHDYTVLQTMKPAGFTIKWVYPLSSLQPIVKANDSQSMRLTLGPNNQYVGKAQLI